ncbi:pyridoxamine 5'-phosphate oxidase family protein [Mycobacterium sp. NPDC003449]
MGYHPGELVVQNRLGQADAAARLGRMIRPEIPAAAAAFLTGQPFIVLAAADRAHRVWAGMIAGPPGFVHADDARTITIDGHPAPGDPLAEILLGPSQVGAVAVQPQTRRRMRVNGTTEPVDGGLRIHTEQVYSNCPKYISRRHIEGARTAVETPRARRAEAMDERHRRVIAATDTFFVGSADPDGNADASHRGGNPGFLEVLSPTQLRWPDYRGNSMFMTLGNIAANPRCGLLIPDWRTGSTIQLTGTAQILWDDGAGRPGAQCSIEFTLTELVELTGVSPWRWGDAELSPANPG